MTKFLPCPYKKWPANRRCLLLSDTHFIQRFAFIFIDFFAYFCYSKIIKHGFGGRDNAVMKSSHLDLWNLNFLNRPMVGLNNEIFPPPPVSDNWSQSPVEGPTHKQSRLVRVINTEGSVCRQHARTLFLCARRQIKKRFLYIPPIPLLIKSSCKSCQSRLKT